jgi:hypothetical protein
VRGNLNWSEIAFFREKREESGVFAHRLRETFLEGGDFPERFGDFFARVRKSRGWEGNLAHEFLGKTRFLSRIISRNYAPAIGDAQSARGRGDVKRKLSR